MKRRIFSFFLALVMAVSSVPQAVFAEEACSHHREHTPECGYQAAIPATPCSHSCTEDSGCSPSEAVCIHTAHDDACGYAEEVPEQPCSFQCTICAGLCEHSLDPDVCNDCNPPILEACPHDLPEEECPDCTPAEIVSQEELHLTGSESEPAPAAEGTSGTCGENLTWVFENLTLTISGTGPMTAWTNTGEIPWYNFQPQRVVLEEGITSITRMSFSSMTFTSITIPASVTSIDFGTFSSSLVQITFLGDAPSCSSCIHSSSSTRATAIIPAGNETYTSDFRQRIGSYFTWMDTEGYQFCSGSNVRWKLLDNGTLSFLGDGQMPGYSNNASDTPWYDLRDQIIAVTVAEGVSSIGSSCFSQLSQLTSVTLPDSLTSIGYQAFRGCSALEAVTIPKNVHTINSGVFADCTGLTQITFLGNAPGSISYDAFSGVTATVTYPAGNPTYTASFKTNYYGNLTWHDTDGNIAAGTRDGLTWVLDGAGTLTVSGNGPIPDYPSYVTPNYEENAPWDGYGKQIKAVVLEPGITAIGSCTFRGRTNITSVTISEGVTKIGLSAFANCTALQEVTLPASLTELSDAAFSGCTALTHVTFLGNAPAVDTSNNYRIFGDSTATVTYPANDNSYTADFKIKCGIKLTWIDTEGNYGSGTLDNGITWLLTSEGVLTISGRGAIPDYPNTSAPWSFDSTRMKKLVLEEGITHVGTRAFYYGEGLEEVTLPTTLFSFGTGSFAGCGNVTRVNVRSVTQWLSLGIGSSFGDYLLYIDGTPITDLVIPEGVTAIKEYQFSGCTGLTSVTFPRSLTEIGHNAFEGCTGLTSITFPGTQNVHVRYDAFTGCTGLTELNLPRGIMLGSEVFSGCTGLKTLTWDNRSLDDSWYSSNSAFIGCTALETVTLLGFEGNSLPTETFSGCTSLHTVALPDTLAEIGDSAFSGCTALTAITLPDSLQTLGDAAFANTGLTEITLPGGMSSIDSNAFAGTQIGKITFLGLPPAQLDGTAFLNMTAEAFYPGALAAWQSIVTNPYYGGAVSLTWTPVLGEEILYSGSCGDNLAWTLDTKGTLAIYGSGPMYDYNNNAPWRDFVEQIRSLSFNGSITRIGNYAFINAVNLTCLTVPGTVEEIRRNAFAGCTSLAELNLSASTSRYGEECFMGCIALTAVTLPALQTSRESSYGGWMFSGCRNLTAAELPEGMTYIPQGMFIGCTSLTTVTLPSTLKTIHSEAFRNCTKLQQINIPGNVAEISSGAFAECVNLSSVALGDGVMELYDGAFFNCISLTAITIPASVTTISWYCFENCTALKTIKFNGRAPQFGDQAFQNVTATAYYYSKYESSWASAKKNYGTGTITWKTFEQLDSGTTNDDMTWEVGADNTLIIRGSGDMMDYTARSAQAPWSSYADTVTAIVLEGSITHIGAAAFSGFRMAATVAIPNTVRSIGYGAFQGCDALKSISYGGSQAQWAEIAVEEGNDCLAEAKLLEPAHAHQKIKVTIDAVACTDEAPGNKAFTTYVCQSCQVWLTDKGVEMTPEQIDALWAKYRTYVKTASVTLLKDGAPADASLAWNLAEGTELQLDAQVLPAGAKQTITWSTSSKAIATVEDGLVTFLKPGTVTITAKGADSKSDKLALTLSVWPEGLNITSEDTNDLRSGKSRTLTAAFTPADTTNRKVTWSVSDTAVASINSSGKLTAKTVYEQTEVTVTAVSKENPAITASYSMYILPKTDEVMSIRANNQSITAQTISCDTSDSFTLSAWSAGYQEENVTWKVNRAGASVDDTGELTFTKNGTYTITAVSADGRTAKTTFKVTTLVRSLTLASKTGAAELASGKTLALSCGVYPENASSKKVTWAITQGAEYAKVSGSGVVTANKGLTEVHTITVTATAADGSGASDSFDVTLRPIATQVVLHQASPVSLDMSKTDTMMLSAHTEPYGLSNQAVTWSSSNKKIADVDADGTVTALRPGTVTIRAVAADGSGKSASIRLTVTVSMTGVRLPETLVLAAGRNHSFNPTIEPANATSKTLVWSLADEDTQFASINAKTGKLTAEKVTQVCTVTVTAQYAEDETVAAQCAVTIYPKATGIQIRQGDDILTEPITITMEDTLLLDAWVDAEEPYLSPLVKWTSSNSRYVKVDADGTVTPVRPGGTVTIKAAATDGSNKSRSIKVSVIRPMEELTLPDTLELTGGKTHTFKATVLPADTTNKTLTWSLAEEDAPFAKIDAKTGRLTTYAVTEPTTITVTASATAEENLGYSATCYVTLYPKPTAIHIRQGDTPITETITLTMEDTLLLDAWVDAGGPYLYPLVKWTSSNTRYVKVETDGTVTPVRPGATVTIKAAAKDNSRAYYSIKVRIIDAP